MADFPHKVYGIDETALGDRSEITWVTEPEEVQCYDAEPERVHAYVDLEVLKSGEARRAAARTLAEARGFGGGDYDSMFEAEVEGVVRALVEHFGGGARG